LKKLARPIIGDKEVRYFGPSTFTWSAYFAEDFIQPFLWYPIFEKLSFFLDQNFTNWEFLKNLIIKFFHCKTFGPVIKSPGQKKTSK
jgi:hypothetical protein